MNTAYESKHKTVFWKLGAALLTALLMMTVSVTAFAYAHIDTNASARLTVSYTDGNETGIVGVSFKLYKVADVSDEVVYKATDAFAAAQIDWSSIPSVDSGDTSWWTTLATTLEAYAAANGITPAASDITNANGQAVFDSLSVGLYLLVGESSIIGDYLYNPSASMILLPSLSVSDEWDYFPTVSVKYTTELLQEYIEISAEKLWDDGDYSGRPGSVIVELARDGEVIDPVQLNEENGWKHTWENLPVVKDLANGTAYNYIVNEKNVPDGYTVEITQDGYSYTITNSYEAPEPEEPTEPDTPDTPSTPDNPTGGPGGDGGTTSTGTTKTGDTANPALWTALLCLALAAMACTGIAYKRRKFAGKHTKR